MSQQINLLNPAFIKKREYFSLPAMSQTFAVILVGALLFSAYAWYQVRQLEAQNIASQQRLSSEQVRVAKLEMEFSPQISSQLRADEIQRLEKKLADATQLVSSLKSGVIGNTLGYSQYMSAFSRQILPGLWLTGFNIKGDATQISITGAAVDAKMLPSYIGRLSNEPSMNGKSFANLKMQQVTTVSGKDNLQQVTPRFVEFTLQSSTDNEAKK